MTSETPSTKYDRITLTYWQTPWMIWVMCTTAVQWVTLTYQPHGLTLMQWHQSFKLETTILKGATMTGQNSEHRSP